jgi:hypothetical protein
VGRSNLLPDRPEIRGMLARVPHLVKVDVVEVVEVVEVVSTPEQVGESHASS